MEQAIKKTIIKSPINKSNSRDFQFTRSTATWFS